MNPPPENAIEFIGVEFRVRSNQSILHNLNLAVQRGEVLMLLGRSGSGKTTSLRLINRLEEPTTGQVRVEGRSTTEWDPIRLRRGIGYAIQEVGLFPHYTVGKNVGLIPGLEGWDRNRIEARTREVLRLVGLPDTDFLERYPDQLSGGQRQRVGLARALAADPPILLMDEPFGALDPLSRVQLQKEFRELQKRLQKTVVFVTHDVGEALMLGDRIALMESGSLRGLFTPKEFLESKDEIVKAYVDAFRAAQSVLNA
jgi:osmoprotectant transport system ATP-binding protein